MHSSENFEKECITELLVSLAGNIIKKMVCSVERLPNQAISVEQKSFWFSFCIHSFTHPFLVCLAASLYEPQCSSRFLLKLSAKWMH